MTLRVTNDGIYIPAALLNTVRRKDHDAVLISFQDKTICVKTVNSEKSSHHKQIRSDGRVRVPNAWVDNRRMYRTEVVDNAIVLR
jgi:hypothetical protein